MAAISGGRRSGCVAIAAYLALAAMCAHPRGASAQSGEVIPRWTSEVAIAGANAMAGGLTAAVTAWLRGDDVTRAFLRGALGGGVVFAGKRLSVESFDGAGLLGRQVGAVGSSVVLNAGMGRAWLDEVWLPVGPVWVEVAGGGLPGLRLDAWTIRVLVWAWTREELELDAAESLSSGAFVFRASEHEMRRGGTRLNGAAAAGVILMSALVRSDFDFILGHERVHVVQQDFRQVTWSAPAEAWGWEKLLGRNVPVWMGTLAMTTPQFLTDLLEAEADILERR